jgi:Holliday junction resolvase RusA-like endonuclease
MIGAAYRIELPFPISVNRIWTPVGSRMVRSKAYRSWIKQADLLFLTQKRKLAPIRMLPGRFDCLLELYTDDLRKRKDADNRIKVCLDFVVRAGLVVDDQYVENLSARWVPREAAPPSGCRFTITSLE